MLPLEERIEALISPSLELMGYRVVRVKMGEGPRHKTLQIMAERIEDGGLNLDDCEEISHQVSAVLDVEDPIAGEYTLEVSSPGLDRPLVKLEDYVRFIGMEAKLGLSYAVEGRKRFKGHILRVEGEDITFQPQDGAALTIPFHHIAGANLVITEDMLKPKLVH